MSIDNNSFPQHWNIIPIKKNSKIPLIKWQEYLKEKYPIEQLKKHDGNFAVICGDISKGLLILDPDIKKGKKQEFLDIIWSKFVKDIPEISTLFIETPNGFHVYLSMQDFTIDRSPNKNRISYHSKKENKEIFTGTVKTHFAEILTGFDILGNNGYALIPPSEVDGKLYHIFEQNPIQTITKEQFDKIMKFFLLDAPKTMRQPFIDILNGKIEIESYCAKTNQKEFLYWKGIFREAFHYCGLTPKEIYPFLKENQPSFEEKVCEEQLKYPYNFYTGTYIDKKTGKEKEIKPFTNEKMQELFPDYSFHSVSPVIHSEVKIEFQPSAVFKYEDIIQEIEGYNGDLNTDRIRQIFRRIPLKCDLEREKIFEKIKEKTNNLLKREMLFKMYKEEWKDIMVNAKTQNSTSETRPNEPKIVGEDIILFPDATTNTTENNGNGHSENSFEFNLDAIEIIDEGIIRSFSYNDSTFREQILDGKIELIKKSRRFKEDLFTYKFRNDLYYTHSRDQMLFAFKHFQYGLGKGKDIVKRAITFLGDKLNYVDLKEIMGFNNGWILPFLEEQQNFQIYMFTQDQNEVYDRCKVMKKNYTPEEKEEIISNLKKLLRITRMDRNKIAIIIGWSLFTPFKVPFLYYYKLTPSLILEGAKNSGKTYLAKLFCVDFYHAWDNFFSGTAVQTLARIEDYLSTSTFPIQIDELEYINDPNVVQSLKASLTGFPDYRRKDGIYKSVTKKMVAPFCITCNHPPKQFEDSALNSKMIHIKYSPKEKLLDDQEWVNVYNFLAEQKLFSFLYDCTKDWNNETVITEIKAIDNNLPENIRIRISRDSRLKKKIIPILFGIELFKRAFQIDLYSFLKIELKDIIDLLEESLMNVSTGLVDKFIEFCIIAREFDPTNKEVKYPKYLTAILESTNNKLYFTHKNIRDFNEFCKADYTLNQLGELLTDGIEKKEYIQYGRPRVNGSQKRAIIIDVKALTTPLNFSSMEKNEDKLELEDPNILTMRIQEEFENLKVFEDIVYDTLIDKLVSTTTFEKTMVELHIKNLIEKEILKVRDSVFLKFNYDAYDKEMSK